MKQMSENETINPANIPRPVYPPTEGMAKIQGKPVTVTNFTHSRVKPREDADPSKIGEDGKVDLFTVETKEVFQLEHKDEGVIGVNNFYSTSFVNNRLKTWAGADTLNGKSISPVKFLKLKKKDNARETFWGVYSEADSEYNQ
mgnify:CR=1 FL=1